MLFSIQLFGFPQVWTRLCCLKTQRSITAMVASAAGSGGSSLTPSSAVLLATVGQQCTLIGWKMVHVFYFIPMLPQPWDELPENRHPCHFLVCNIKWWLFYLKLGSDHWKIIAWWFVIWGLVHFSRDVCVFCRCVYYCAALWYVTALCKRPPRGPLMLHVFSGLEVLYIYCINAECHKIK